MFVAITGRARHNIVLKDLVARPRPFESSTLFLDWWRFAGAARTGSRSPPGLPDRGLGGDGGAHAWHAEPWKTVLGGSNKSC